tara:strand:- start:2294 stop:3184 length:891 start_codon:yes stop_codon:yes gene_type:complete
MFDIMGFYQDEAIDYYLEGKNVMKGWVNINCPFCDDKSNHLGVFIKRPRIVKCWRCGEHSLPNVLSHISNKDIKVLYKEYKAEGEEIKQEKKKKAVAPIEEIRKEFEENSRTMNLRYLAYIRKRGFDALVMEKEWDLKGGLEMGRYRYRLMIPIYSNGRIVSFQARDITGKQDPKYISCHNSNIKEYLYGIDYVHNDRVFICEGVTDVWRLGKGNAVATFGIEYTEKQKRLIRDKNFEYVIVFFDSEPQAQERALSLIAELELSDIHCTNLVLEDKDPADLTKKEVDKFIKLLNSK